MASYAVALNSGVRNQSVQFPNLPTQTVISVEIDFHENPVFNQDWTYLVDAGRGSPSGSGYIRFKNSGKFDFEAITNIKIDGVVQSWLGSGTTFAGSGLDSIAGKTLSFDILTGFAGTLSVGNIIASTSGVQCSVSAVRVHGRNYELNEGAGTELNDSVDQATNDGLYVNPPANNAQWVLLGGGAENYSGTALAAASSNVPVEGYKSAAGLAQSLSSSAFGLFGSKFTQGVSASSDSTAVSPTGVKTGQGVISASSDADALFLGGKAGAGTVIVSVVPELNVSGLVHFFGSVGAQCVSALALQGVIGGAVIHKSGFAISSSAPAVLVSGLKSAIGAVVCSNGNDVSLEAVKSAEGRCVFDQAEVVLLLGVAVKAGILVDATNAVLIATGANPDAEVHKSVYEFSAIKRDYLYQGVANRVVQLEGRLAA